MCYLRLCMAFLADRCIQCAEEGFVLIPFELGYLLYQGKKRNGNLSLRGIVLYR